MSQELQKEVQEENKSVAEKLKEEEEKRN